MIREIKFRVGDKSNNQFFYMDFMDPRWTAVNPTGVLGRDYVALEASVRSESNPMTYRDPSIKFGPKERSKLVWQQFTGIKDRDNKKIYEGDLLTIWLANDPIGSGLVEVKWSDRGEFILVPRTIKEVDLAAMYFRGTKCVTGYDGEGDPIWTQTWFDHPLSKFNGCILQIEGNIFENPELLK